MIFQTIGCALLLIGVGIAYWQYDLLKGKAVSEGRVVALEPQDSSDGGPTYKLVAEFKDHVGTTHQYRSGFSSSSTGYRVGDPIRIYFDRNAPGQCGVLSFGYRFGIAWCLALTGVALILGNVGWRVGNEWLKTQFPTTTGAQPEAGEYRR
jgi:hypothetical protein